jgi:hypothetical protein
MVVGMRGMAPHRVVAYRTALVADTRPLHSNRAIGYRTEREGLPVTSMTPRRL